jgi:Flp pilus assembly protein TadB
MERMPQFSRPVYEGLPWFYIICGLAVLGGSYLLAAHGLLSLMVGLVGFLLLLFGVVLVLRRRDYRELRSQYVDPDSLGSNKEP